MIDVFLSWSGATSKCLADQVFNAFPTIFERRVKLFYSPAIDPGAIWIKKIAPAIRKSRVAILCVTHDNVSSPWLQFEAGALWHRHGGTGNVCPLLLDVSPNELPGTLQLFQTRRFDKKGFRELCEFIGRKAGIGPTPLRNNFKAVWPGLEPDVQACLSVLGSR